MGSKLINCCKPGKNTENVGNHPQTERRLSAGLKWKRMESRRRKNNRQKWKECKRPREEFAAGGFVAQTGLWNIGLRDDTEGEAHESEKMNKKAKDGERGGKRAFEEKRNR